MNGQLSEQPLAELIREISAKSLSGRLRLEHERVHAVAYFEDGQLLYAASNLRALRAREYLKNVELIAEADLAQVNDGVSDRDLFKVLSSPALLGTVVATQMQTRLVASVLRMALLWTEGAWEFESRSRLSEQLHLELDMNRLLLEAARRLPAKFTASRFPDAAEIITPIDQPAMNNNLLPAEVFLLSRVDRPTTVRELVAISGLGQEETLGHLYTLTIVGLLKRERWPTSFRSYTSTTPKKVAPPPPPPPVEREQTRDTNPPDVDSFLARVKNAQTHYDVLGVTRDVTAPELKAVYYQLARRYHPDLFRKSGDAGVLARIESAFARITQAYDTLHDDQLRAGYNAKLAARRKVEQIVDAAPQVSAPTPEPEPVAEGASEPVVPAAERAASQFKEGLMALEQGQKKVALALFASAARAVPNEPRYRASYGQLLAQNESTRRAAEAELNAAIKLDPKNAGYRMVLAELYRDLGLKLRAKGEAERAVAADPNNRKARELLRTLK